MELDRFEQKVFYFFKDAPRLKYFCVTTGIQQLLSNSQISYPHHKKR